MEFCIKINEDHFGNAEDLRKVVNLDSFHDLYRARLT